MSHQKTKKKLLISNKKSKRYVEILNRAQILISSDRTPSSLKQPSLLEDVDSVTTYEITAKTQEWS